MNSHYKVSENEIFLEYPLTSLAGKNFKYIRASLSYQNYDIKLREFGFDLVGTLASFVGYNTYIKEFTVKSKSKAINANRKQGYWAFEQEFIDIIDGQAPEGATTVPNPIWSNSPIPEGSCLVTGNIKNS